MADSELNMSTPAASPTRDQYLSYWQEHTGSGTIEAMMLDSQAKVLDASERPEILGYLPSIEGMKVMELGAGMGRFTPWFAERAREVLAVDFVEASIEKNKTLHADKYPNTQFLCADVTTMTVPEPGMYDMVFSNWLLMYLSDDEVTDFAANTLTWVQPGGYLFFRESCFHPSGDKSRKSNPTQYRTPDWYQQTFTATSPAREGWTWEVVKSGSVESYVKLKDNANQVYWLCRKVPATAAGSAGDAVSSTA